MTTNSDNYITEMTKFVKEQIECGVNKEDILKVASSNDIKDIIEAIYNIEKIKIKKLKKENIFEKVVNHLEDE